VRVPGARRPDVGAIQHSVLRGVGAPPRGARPRILRQTALRDPQIRALCRRVRLVPEAGAAHAGMASTVAITPADGRRAENGMLEPGELEDKFLRLTRRALGGPGAAALLERLKRLEDEQNLDWLGAQP
jgi:hypothetical protein